MHKHCGKNFTHAFSKYGFHGIAVHETRKCSRHYMQICGANFVPSRSQNVEITDRNSFTLLSKVWPSVGLFSRNSRLLDNFYWTTPTLHIMKNRRKVWSPTLSHKRAGKCGLHIRHSFFLLRNGRLKIKTLGEGGNLMYCNSAGKAPSFCKNRHFHAMISQKWSGKAVYWFLKMDRVVGILTGRYGVGIPLR